jgi:tRNA nucleotidyltransferase/poly(A) polymerase
MTFKFYEVGGCVRDKLLKIPSGDVDFSVVYTGDKALSAEGVFRLMLDYLKAEGFEIFQPKPQFTTVKAKVPKGHPLREHTQVADFVLARVDGPYVDGRRPEYTLPGTLLDDLARRDFTFNAIAIDPETGAMIDPFQGAIDLKYKLLRFVGDPWKRIDDDSLRAVRGIRFLLKYDLEPAGQTWEVITSTKTAKKMRSIKQETLYTELLKLFTSVPTAKILEAMGSLPQHTLEVMFPTGLSLTPSAKLIHQPPLPGGRKG